MNRFLLRFLLGFAVTAAPFGSAYAAGIAVEGVVRSADGLTVPGARVELRHPVSRYEAGLSELDGRDQPAPVAQTGPDRMGRFRLSVPQAGLWRLVAVAEGFVPMEISALPILEEIRLPQVTLRADGRLRVRVVDAGGNPVPGAQVLGKTGKPALWGTSDWQPTRRIAMTGPDGTLRLPRAHAEPLLLWAERPGFPAQGGNPVAGRETILTLQPGIARFLLALDAEGHPLPEALVRDPRSSLALGRFDGQHPLVLAAPAGGLWDLRVELADGRRMSFRTGESQRPSETSPIPLRLTAAVPVAGRIVDATGRRPLAGALVWPIGDPASAARTDAAGVYRLAGRIAGASFELRAAAAGHAPGQLKVGFPFRSSESLRQAPDLGLVPAYVAALAGVVVDEAARPVSGAEIRLVRPDPDVHEWLEEPRLARSSPDGSFRIAPLEAGGLYKLTATRPGFAPATLPVAVSLAPGSGRPIRLTLTRGRTAFGLVLDVRQRPIPGARVKLTVEQPEGRSEARAELEPFHAETDAGGRFRVPGLPAGFFELRIEGLQLAPLPAKVISVPQGDGLLDLGTFTMEGRPRIAGWIVDPEGRPVEGADIWVVPQESTTVTEATRRAGPATVTGRDGHFELQDRSVGDHEKLRACRKGYLPAELQAQGPESSEPRIALTPSTLASGRVVNASGDPVHGARVSASLSGQVGSDLTLPDPPCPFEESANVDGEGAFTLELKGPGRYNLMAWGAGYLLTKLDHVLVPPEGAVGLEIRLDAGMLVEGRVTNSEDHAIAGASITLSGSRSISQTFSDGNGDYVLEGVGVGVHTLQAEHPDYEPGGGDVDIPEQGKRLNLTMLFRSKHLEIRGRVSYAEGAPVEGAIVSAAPARTSTASDGSFSLPARQGSNTLVAEKDGFAPDEVDGLTVDDRSLDGVQIRLGHGVTLTGRVLGVDPAAVNEGSIWVQISGSDLPEIPAPLDAAGRFEVSNLPSGPWGLYARAGERKASDRFTPPAGQTQVVHDLEFAPASEVRGRVTGPGGEPVEGASLLLEGDPDARFQAQAQRDGTFAIEVPDGTYKLSTSADHYAGRDVEPVVVAGAPVDVDVQLGPDVVLTGRLLGLERGDTLKSFEIEGPPGFHPGAWTVDQEAHYRQTGLGPGDWTVKATFLVGYQDREATGKIHIPKGAAEATLDLDFHIEDLADSPAR